MKYIDKLLLIAVLFISVLLVYKKTTHSDISNTNSKDYFTKNCYIIETDLGDITIKVYPKKAPITVGNFIKYVQLSNFEGATFYRVVRMDNQPINPVKIAVIQGNFIAEDKALPPIPHETTKTTGILHKNGTVSMARSEPGTASAAFFICINDQPALDYGGKRNPDGQGFAAFGEVIKGMDIVKKIQAGETNEQSLKTPIKIHRIYKQGSKKSKQNF